MHVYFENLSQGKIPYWTLRAVEQALAKQLKRDFMPLWDCKVILCHIRPRSIFSPDRSQDAVVYICDRVDHSIVQKHHDKKHKDIPYRTVYIETAEQLGQSWTVLLSQAVMGLNQNIESRLVCRGPRPENQTGEIFYRFEEVFYRFEVCDPVQTESYKINDIEVSNFVLPMYFSVNKENPTRTNFLGSLLPSFTVRPGSYVIYYDPKLGHEIRYTPDDSAKRRATIRNEKLQ